MSIIINFAYFMLGLVLSFSFIHGWCANINENVSSRFISAVKSTTVAILFIVTGYGIGYLIYLTMN